MGRHGKAPKLLGTFDLGDCLLTIAGICNAMIKLGNWKDHQTLRQKQMLFLSMTCLDVDDGSDCKDCNYDHGFEHAKASVHDSILFYWVAPTCKPSRCQIMRDKC